MRKFFLFLFFGVTLLSCSKFLDVKPKGVIIATTISDYEAVMNDAIHVASFGNNDPRMVTDDGLNLTLSPQGQMSIQSNLYFWRPYINISAESPAIWLDYYRRIANLNVVTEGVMQAENGTEKKKKQLYAEAMVYKVFCYLHLLSYFSPAYDPQTAGSVYGVPYVTSTDISLPTPQRPTLEAFCRQLTGDILAAIPDLEETAVNNTRVTTTVAYAMLSRLYLYMQDYPRALQYADAVIKKANGKVLNYNEYSKQVQLPHTNSSPEEIFVRYYVNSRFRYSDDLIQQFDTAADLRIRFFTKRSVAGNPAALVNNGMMDYNPNMGITYPEIVLTKAECLARQGAVDDAMRVVNQDLRVYRFPPDKYQPLAATTKEEAITAVLSERRRELALKGTRWIDMKRLDVQKRMPPVKRIAADGITVLAVLEPGSPRYTFQIPLQVQAFNPTMPLNKE
ncbi:RagB/SusD family nutrient uptake outer membrane protein [Chitinophaga varians]|uniref:RagB/SusD family nutrient uptake outer membrane protein n=1 Tax=Chitinophaga varians TaxID=2202339 RepID=UPI00165FBF69|nr:RagB/SusD family nutrient uptake outer membrane protein [Chitinophaga varians]MBC9914942.1 RagB/SusD family nutrient uptake outer membrane protein [Chitinophaga varians]